MFYPFSSNFRLFALKDTLIHGHCTTAPWCFIVWALLAMNACATWCGCYTIWASTHTTHTLGDESRWRGGGGCDVLVTSGLRGRRHPTEWRQTSAASTWERKKSIKWTVHGSPNRWASPSNFPCIKTKSWSPLWAYLGVFECLCYTSIVLRYCQVLTCNCVKW